jgi:hypothetical protein
LFKEEISLLMNESVSQRHLIGEVPQLSPGESQIHKQKWNGAELFDQRGVLGIYAEITGQQIGVARYEVGRLIGCLRVVCDEV